MSIDDVTCEVCGEEYELCNGHRCPGPSSDHDGDHEDRIVRLEAAVSSMRALLAHASMHHRPGCSSQAMSSQARCLVPPVSQPGSYECDCGLVKACKDLVEAIGE